MDYKQILDDILELDENITIIRGVADVVIDPLKARTLGYLPDEMIFKDFKADSYWVILGRGTDEMIVETMSEAVCEVDCEGEYEFKCVLKWVPGEYDECGRCTMRDYLEVEYIEFHFIQTFLERERESKISDLLDFDNLFDI